MKTALRIFLTSLCLFASSVSYCALENSPQLTGQKILKRYLRLHPIRTWNYDWEAAIFLFGAIRFCESQRVVSNTCAFVDEYFSSLTDKTIPDITMPDVAAMSLPAVAWVPHASPKALANIQQIVSKTNNYFETEPLNKKGTYDHAGQRHSFAPWLPPTAWFVPSSVWIDSSVMYVLNGFFEARFLKSEKNEEFFISQMRIFQDTLFDQKALLYKHAYYISWDFFAPFSSYWARGNGWMVVALTEMLESLSAQNAQYTFLKEGLVTALKNLKLHADPKKGFRTLLTDKSPFSRFESSSSALFAYALLKSSRLGFVDPEAGEFAAKLKQSLIQTYLKPSGEDEISVTKISGPTMAVPFDWYYKFLIPTKTDKSYGVGAFLLLLSEPGLGG